MDEYHRPCYTLTGYIILKSPVLHSAFIYFIYLSDIVIFVL